MFHKSTDVTAATGAALTAIYRPNITYLISVKRQAQLVFRAMRSFGRRNGS